MDRINFASSISYSNISQEQCIHENFDKVMLLYNLIHNENVKIEAVNGSNIEFMITTNIQDEVNRIRHILSYKVMNIYGREFVIESIPIDNVSIKVLFNLKG